MLRPASANIALAIRRTKAINIYAPILGSSSTTAILVSLRFAMRDIKTYGRSFRLIICALTTRATQGHIVSPIKTATTIGPLTGRKNATISSNSIVGKANIMLVKIINASSRIPPLNPEMTPTPPPMAIPIVAVINPIKRDVLVPLIT